MFPKLLDWQLKYPKTLLIITLLIIAGFAYEATTVEINPQFDALIPQTGTYNTNERAINNAYQANQGLAVLIQLDRTSRLEQRPSTVTGPRFEQYYDELREVINQSQYVLSVSPPQYADDKKTARIGATLTVPESNDGLKDVKEQLSSLVDQVGPPPGATATLAGFPLLIDRVPTLLIQDNLRTVSITFLLIAAILTVYFRNIRTSLITVLAPLASLTILAGLMGIFNIDITITLAAVAVLMLGLGADYTIHLMVHYNEERRDGATPTDALRTTLNDLRLAITGSFMTTLAGFAALILGVSPSSQAQGLVLSFGIIAIYAVSVFLVPLLIILFCKDVNTDENFIFRGVREAMTNLAVYQSKRPLLVLGTLALATIVMIGGMTQVSFSTSNSNWVPADDPVSQAFRDITWTYGNTDTLDIILTAKRGDLRDVQTARDAQRLATLLSNIPNVDNVDNPYKDLPLDAPSIHDTLTNERSDAFNPSYTLTRLTVQSENFDQDESGDSLVLQEVRDLVEQQPIHNADLSLFGDIVRFDELGTSLQQDTGVTTMIGLALVLLVVSVTYASIVVGITALLPIIIAVIWAVGLMGYFDVPFTSLSTGIVSLVLGIGADFSIHLVDGIKRYTNRGHPIEASIRKTLDSSGNAILLASITTLFGFTALTSAVLLGTQRLGLSLAFSMIAVFLVSVSFVPAVMSIYLGKRIKTGSAS